MLGSGVNLITTVIGFGLSATFIVFVCTRLIYVRIRRMQSRQMPRTVDLELVPANHHGGTPSAEVLNIRSSEDTICSICLGEYQEKEMLKVMPKCGHTFHLSCIDIWLRKHSTCPVCRLPIQHHGG
ncbi:hypothetical protein M569_11582 [Genlisea aurea]|uniref:RING-type domain-containing protein n=1 Tax=Genlisea aurea TaxID=192259 RepID=S8CF84_9LAMI|nr:hypothetical protein M569_11582 [Genlisea aurea]